MMNKVRQSPLISLLVCLLAACGGQATDAPTLDVDSINTSAVGTFSASMYQTQTAAVPSASATSTLTATSTAISLISATSPSVTATIFAPVLSLPTIILSPTVTGTQYTPTINPSTLGVGCNNLYLVQDVTIPAGTVLKPQEAFTKTWKVANTGTCDWVYQYQLVFISGERMDGEGSRLNNVIVPGKWTQLSVNLTAPSQPGTYTGYWRLATQSGAPFGATLAVSIVVANPTSTPEPSTNTPVPTDTNTPTATPTNTP